MASSSSLRASGAASREQAAPVRYRLADLYWEKAKRAFFRANDSTTPLSISARIAASSGQSTVHHQSENGVRWSRWSMGVPKWQR